MDFERAVAYLENLVSYERFQDFKYSEENYDLRRFRDFLEEYAVEYGNLRAVHVAGSKGKGTVCRMVAEYLSKSGRKVGLFTSPHIFDLRERFWMDGEMISRDRFAAYVSDLAEFLEERGDFKLTYFEALTVIAFKWFLDEGVDYAVLEVGLGGRLDSTNVIQPLVCGLAHVEMEHKGILGDSLEEILGEKLGILKNEVPMLVGEQSDDVMDLLQARNDERFLFVEEGNKGLALGLLREMIGDVDVGFFEQIVNDLKILGHFDERKIKGKKVIFDVAHTVSSIKRLISRLGEKKKVFLISIMKGKDAKGIAELILPIAERIIFCFSNKERAYSGEELKKIFGMGEVIDDCDEAFEKVLKDLKKDQALVVTGSHFLISKLLPQNLSSQK